MTAIPASPDRQTRRVVFRGRVQGVGFRYTCATLARECNVQGHVRNRADGCVELVAQGLAADVDRLLTRLAEHFAGYIQGQTVEDFDDCETFTSFEVRR